MRILGIETSCDETAAAVVEDGRKMLSNEIVSSIDLHAFYGGIVPEIAARSHMEAIIPVIDEALETAHTAWNEIDAIAVTEGPGLLGSLLIGVLTARSLAIVKNKPLLAINHVEAHVYAGFITETELKDYSLPKKVPKFPLLALIISGGHTQLVLFTDHNKYQVLGRTKDDAVGEAFDKVGKVLGLPYPGGLSISQAAKKGNPLAIELPSTKLKSPYDFSFSGLKTAALRAAQAETGKDFTFPSYKLAELLTPQQTANMAASFQRQAIEQLLVPLARAEAEFKPKSIVIAGGVAANAELRKQAGERLKSAIIFPDIKLCTDNAAMIAGLGYFKASLKAQPAISYSLEPQPSLTM